MEPILFTLDEYGHFDNWDGEDARGVIWCRNCNEKIGALWVLTRDGVSVYPDASVCDHVYDELRAENYAYCNVQDEREPGFYRAIEGGLKQAQQARRFPN